MKKKLAATLCLMAMVVSTLTGCGQKSLYEEAMSKANKAKSMEAKATMDIAMNMSVMGQTQDIDMKMNMDMAIFQEPLKMKMNVAMDMLGQNMEMNSYVAKEGDKYMSYTGMSGQWTKQEVCSADDIETAKKEANAFDAAQFLLAKETVTEGEEVEENGKKYKTYTGKMTKEMMEKSLESSTSSLVNSGVDEATMNKVLESMTDIPYTMWIDVEDKSLYRVKYSMADVMNSIMSVVMKEELSGTAGSSAEVQKALEELKIEVSKCDMDIVYSNYNKAKDFEVPEEALKAESATTEAKAE